MQKTIQLHEAKYYTPNYNDKEKLLQCTLCPRLCIIQDGEIGFCNVRQNVNGKLYSLVYGKAAAIQIDPIEKKPLFHFLPGSTIYSVGTVGCNLHCKYCQNFHTSQTKPGHYVEYDLSSEEIVQEALEHGCKSIATTYNDPTIFYEYVLDTFKIAHKKGLKTVMVTNGFMCLEPEKELAPYVDALNIDLKGFTNKFYGSTTASWLQPVLDSVKFWHSQKKWVELTNLVIPTLNDNMEDIKSMCMWIKKNVGVNVPLHFTAFHPDYQMMHIPHTSEETLFKAYKLAKQLGLRYVYVGNINGGDKENTYCPHCKKLLVERYGYHIEKVNIVKGKCVFCKEKIPGFFG